MLLATVVGRGVAATTAQVNAMYSELIILVLLGVAAPVIAFFAFMSFAKTKRRRRQVQHFRLK
jgi:hypothetical protein